MITIVTIGKICIAYRAVSTIDFRFPEKIVCYYSSWAVYRPGDGKIEINDIDPRLCTHLIYSFIGINADGSIRIMDSWSDLANDGGKNGFGKFVSLSKQNSVKAMVAIGGWNEGSTKFSEVVNDPGRRSRFVQNAVNFLNQYNFHGLDVDWEYPNQRGGKSADRESFVALLRELKEAFSKYGYILSVAVGAAEKSASKSYIINQVASNVDFVNLMTYDMNGAWNNFAGLNAPLYASSKEQGEQSKLNVVSGCSCNP